MPDVVAWPSMSHIPIFHNSTTDPDPTVDSTQLSKIDNLLRKRPNFEHKQLSNIGSKNSKQDMKMDSERGIEARNFCQKMYRRWIVFDKKYTCSTSVGIFSVFELSKLDT